MPTLKNNSREFVLVLIMLVVLTTLVAFILFPTIPKTELEKTSQDYLKDSQFMYQSTLEYRKSLLAIILTAFGAWVGAGAAYFFGRENLRESANSLLQLHQQMLGIDKLKLLKVRDIPPKPLDSNFDDSSTIGDTLKKLQAKPNNWFISMQTDKQWFIVTKEAISIYLNKELEKLSKIEANKDMKFSELNDQLIKQTLKEVIPNLKKDDSMKIYIDQYLTVKLDDNAGEVNDKMDETGVFLAIVKDDAGNLIQYFTTSDIRKALLKI